METVGTRKLRLLMWILAGTSVCALSAPVLAQQASAPVEADNTGIADIVVTAQKRSESTSKVPISIAAFSGDTLEKLRIRDAADLGNTVPGFSVATSSNNTPIYTIRGIGFNSQAMSYTSPVGVYVDEVSYAFPYMSALVAFDLDRVEVLKGPQGSLYGRNTTGGAVNFVPKLPTDHLKGALTLNGGNFASYGAEGYISGPLTSTLGARFAFRVDRSDDGWQHSISRPDDRLGKKREYAGRATLHWEPDDSFQATLSGTYWLDKSDTIALQAIKFLPLVPGLEQPGDLASVRSNPKGNQADWAPAGYPGAPFNATAARGEPFQSDTHLAAVSLRMTKKFSDTLSLTSLTGYNYLKAHDYNSFHGVPLQHADTLSYGHIGSFNQEVRLAGDFDRLNIILGGYYSHDDIRDLHDSKFADMTNFRFLRTIIPGAGGNRFTADQYATAGAVLRADTASTFNTAAVFANATYHLTDTLKVTGAARFTAERGHSTGCLRDVDGLSLPVWQTIIAGALGGDPGFSQGGCIQLNADGTIHPVTGRIHDNTVSWRANVDWQVAPDTLLYANISRGYKSAIFPVAPGVRDSTLAPVPKEKVTSYEAGLKTKLLDRRAQFTLAGFYNDYRNKQIKDYIPDSIFGLIVSLGNVPKSETYGIDAQLDYQATRNLRLTTGLLWLKTKILSYSGYDAQGVLTDFSGLRLPFSPEWSVNGAAVYTVPLKDGLSLEATGSVNYRTSTTGQPSSDPLYGINSYALVDASIALVKQDRWKASLWAKNLTNKYYWTNVDNAGEAVVRTPGMVRTWGGSVTFDF